MRNSSLYLFRKNKEKLKRFCINYWAIFLGVRGGGKEEGEGEGGRRYIARFILNEAILNHNTHNLKNLVTLW